MYVWKRPKNKQKEAGKGTFINFNASFTEKCYVYTSIDFIDLKIFQNVLNVRKVWAVVVALL